MGGVFDSKDKMPVNIRASPAKKVKSNVHRACRAKFRTSPKIVPLAYANNVIEAKINLAFCKHIRKVYRWGTHGDRLDCWENAIYFNRFLL